MRYVKTNVRLVGAKDSIATRDIESLFRCFEIMQDEKLQSPTKASVTLTDGSTCSNLHRLSVRIYYVPSPTNQPAR
jgi:hypothetical protein